MGGGGIRLILLWGRKLREIYEGEELGENNVIIQYTALGQKLRVKEQ